MVSVGNLTAAVSEARRRTRLLIVMLVPTSLLTCAFVAASTADPSHTAPGSRGMRGDCDMFALLSMIRPLRAHRCLMLMPKGGEI